MRSAHVTTVPSGQTTQRCEGTASPSQHRDGRVTLHRYGAWFALLRRRAPGSTERGSAFFAEYALLVAVVAAGLMAGSFYLKRGLMGQFRRLQGQIGQPYRPGSTDAFEWRWRVSSSSSAIDRIRAPLGDAECGELKTVNDCDFVVGRSDTPFDYEETEFVETVTERPAQGVFEP